MPTRRRHDISGRGAALQTGTKVVAVRGDTKTDLHPTAIAPGSDADTVIRELIDRAPHPADLIVVTSDKALYSYARTMGAAVLRAHEWNALERRIDQARESKPGAEKPEREDDVEGWLRKFGSS